MNVQPEQMATPVNVLQDFPPFAVVVMKVIMTVSQLQQM